jgi:catechol 2,3-dioxygenase-like lactoylglutathione lyase family enzyme
MNIIPQKLGRQAGLEHFGLEVEDVEKVSARLREKYPAVQLIKRPTNRPFAGISTHDPEGYVFDLSQQDMTNRAEVYVEGEWKQDRTVSHFVLRALHPANLAKFYRKSMNLQELEKPGDDPNHYLTDGRVTWVSPGAITDHEGCGHRTAAHGSLGLQSRGRRFVQKNLQSLVKRNPALAPKPGGTEGEIDQAAGEVQARPIPACGS